MATRRRLLAFLTRAELLQLAADHEHSGLTGKPKDEIVEAIVERPRPSKPEVLEHFSRKQLKEACEELGLDTTGREKQMLIDRLLGREDEEDDEVKAVAAAKSRKPKPPPVEPRSDAVRPERVTRSAKADPPAIYPSGQAMLTRMRLKNLKTWGEQLWDNGVELSAITLFLGANSAGKTSLLQLPLLLKQTFESPDRLIHLNLGGQSSDLVDLGSYKSLIHQHETKRELGIGLSANVAREGGASTSLDYEATYKNSTTGPVVQRLMLASHERSFSVTRQGKGGYRIEAPGYQSKKANGSFDARRPFQPERSLAFSQEAIAELGPAGAEIQDLSLLLRRAIGQVVYLGPLREPPERTYLWSGVDPRDIGKRGELAVHALLASDNARSKQRPGVEGGRQWLVGKVSTWLQKLGVADELILERQGNSRHYELVVVRGRQRANLMDVGFGVSQVLPMIVLAYTVSPGTTIIAEQPELHLHPGAQGGLAQLMAEVSRTRKVQFLVETHSEHLFRRLQTLVAEEELAPEHCALYFVDAKKDGEAELRRLELDGFGRVANWPKQFFGDAVGETERQMRTMLRRVGLTREGRP